jgi:hypothetical protein
MAGGDVLRQYTPGPARNWSYGALKDMLLDSRDSGTHREAEGMLGEARQG